MINACCNCDAWGLKSLRVPRHKSCIHKAGVVKLVYTGDLKSTQSVPTTVETPPTWFYNLSYINTPTLHGFN